MPHPTSLARASRALRRAISLSPASHPLRGALQVLSNPLTHCSAYTQLDDTSWQATLNYLTVFADGVIQALINSSDNDALESLHKDALELHLKLDQKGFHTAFCPSHVSATSLAALSNCADSSEQTAANMSIVSTSLLATFECLKQIFDTPVTLVDPIGALSNVADRHRKKPPPPPGAAIPSLNTLDFEQLSKSYDEFIAKLNRVPMPELSRTRVHTFVDLLWKQPQLSESRINVEGSSSNLPCYDHVLSRNLSFVAKAHLEFAADHLPETGSLWKTAVALKTLIFPSASHQKRIALQQEMLRLKVLSHPCIPVFYGALWPRTDNSRSAVQHVHIVTERMTKSIRSCRQEPALQPFEVRVRVLRDIADAIKYLHSQEVAHGSLCPENVLIRICDDRIYGHAKVDITGFAMNTLAPNIRKHPLVYRSPEELFEREQFFTSDIWSFGVLACFLLAESVQENDEDDYRLAAAFATLGKEVSLVKDWARQISNDRVRELVIRCVYHQPERRPNASEVQTALSEILREKSVKADTLAEGVKLTGDSEIDRRFSTEEGVRDSQAGTCGGQWESSSKSHVPNVSVKNGKVPNIVRRETSDHHQSEARNFPETAPSHKSIHDSLNLKETSKDSDDEDREQIGLDIADEKGLDDIFRFQVDERGRTRCVKRKPRLELPRAYKRVRVDQSGYDKVPGSSKLSAELSQATMEEIFGPFSGNELSDSPCHSRVKAEDILQKPSSAITGKSFVVSNATRVKTETEFATMTEDTVPQGKYNLEHTSGGPKSVSRRNGEKEEAQLEPLLPNRTNEGGSSSKTKHTPKRKGRRQRSSNKERRRSRNRGTNEDSAPYKAKQKSLENPPSTSWKGRVRKRIQKPSRYTERIPSPAPSSLSHGMESIASFPSDHITGVEGNDSLSRVQKRARASTHIKREDNSANGSLGVQDHTKAKYAKSMASEEGLSIKKRDPHVDMFFEFVKGAREGESMVDFYHRESKNGKISAFVRLGFLYEEGKHVQCDYDIAFSCYQRAAAAGDGEGQFRLARCYEDGRGVSKNEPAAAALFIQAADADNAHAQFKAGVCFEAGKGVARDMNKALHYFYKSVEQEHPDACYRLAKYCREGKGMKKDDVRALELYKAASDAEHVPSMVQLANMYAKGQGGSKRSISRAVALYRRASEAGDPEAKLSLGLLHEDGQGVKKSSESALRLYREAAEAGHAPAMTALGQCFLWGYGIKQDFRKAVDLFRCAAEKDDALAQHELGNCYKDGTGVDKDCAKALYYYREASASGSSVALVRYGEFLYGGNGVPQDYDRAFEQFKRAADLGAAEGYRWLGECYADGTGVTEDHKKAFQMYQKGAELGSTNAQTCLGVCYENGIGVDQSKSKALHWYRKGASDGNHTAMNNLGIFYEQGKLVKRDAKRAVSYYRKAIDLGSVDAICNLADCYAGGNGVDRDMKTAVQLYQDAANHGMSGAQCELGVCYYYGKGVHRNAEKATDLFNEASNSEPEALRHLGTCFYDGKGVQRDYTTAVKLYKKAISKGNRDACFNLALCYTYGNGVAKDDRAAVSLLTEAADQGNRYAKLTLGNRYFEGRGVKKDVKRAVILFSEAGEIDLTQPLTDDRIVEDDPKPDEMNS